LLLFGAKRAGAPGVQLVFTLHAALGTNNWLLVEASLIAKAE